MSGEKSSFPRDLEIPRGKRTKIYRFFEILPGALSYGLIIGLFLISWISPTAGAIYLLIIITITLVRAIGVAVRTVQGYNVIRMAMKVNWHKRLADLENPHESFERRREKREWTAVDYAKMEIANQGIASSEYNYYEHIDNLREISVAPENYPKPSEIYNAVIMVAYDEGLETLVPSVEAVLKTTFDLNRIIFVLGYEERGGPEMEARARELLRRYKDKFYKFMIVKHPDGLPGEIIGKGPNTTYAGRALLEFVEKKKIPTSNVIVTTLDSDNQMSPKYLDYLTYEYIVHPERKHLAYQPVALFMNNIWDAAPPMRIIATSNSFFNVINTMRPHAIRNFASHAQPLDALVELDFWSRRTVVEDGHQYWRSLFYFKGDYRVLSIKVPIYQDAVIDETLGKTLKAQFVQLRRWDYGVSDVAYVGEKIVNKKKRRMPFFKLLPKFTSLLGGHVMLAAMSPMVAFGGWVPSLLNGNSRQLLTYNLPQTVSFIQLFASIGLFITILFSLKMLPPRPKKYTRFKNVFMVLQWILMPVVAILYQSAAAFYAQTRLMTGHYMEKFDVTRKVVKAS
ncbi:glycosyltransferase family 2 protein [Candidatus Saccharibacteria bacterium]|nr:glycosyltransferase family 2 protein [Candidatus Saccharibacteria bacterium]